MFPRTVLKVVPSGEERYYLTTFNTGVFTLKLRLPPDTWCDQCILQWTYTAGNNWGNCDEKDREGGGASALGCGPQVPLWILEIVFLDFVRSTQSPVLDFVLGRQVPLRSESYCILDFAQGSIFSHTKYLRLVPGKLSSLR